MKPKKKPTKTTARPNAEMLRLLERVAGLEERVDCQSLDIGALMGIVAQQYKLPQPAAVEPLDEETPIIYRANRFCGGFAYVLSTSPHEAARKLTALGVEFSPSSLQPISGLGDQIIR